MNKRIEELLAEATDDIMGVGVVNHEKFANLIVQECIHQVSNLMDHTDYMDNTEAFVVELKTLRDARQAIKEQFGVL